MRSAYGFGISTTTDTGEVLDTWYQSLGLGSKPATAPDLSALLVNDPIRRVTKDVVAIEIDLDVAPASVPDAYLRLHLLSHRIVQPHGLVLDGIFGILNNVAWTSAGPCSLSTINEVAPVLRAKLGALTIFSVDKFPRMVDYVIP